jgi:hypothetical protein
VDQFPEVAGQIQRSSTGVGEDIPGILIGYTVLLVCTICPLDNFQVIRKFILIDALWDYILKAILRAVPLATLGKAAMPVSHQLMGTCPGDTFNFEGEVDVFHN